MKNKLKMIAACLGLLFVGCTDETAEIERDSVVAQTAPVLRAPGNDFSMVLQLANANNYATTFVWDFGAYSGTQTVTNYAIEFATPGTNFANAKVVATSISKFKEFNVGELNQAALDAGFVPFIEANIAVRIKATVGTLGSGIPQYSNSFTIKLTPYPSWPNWGIIGSATPTGWSSDTNMGYNLQTKIYSVTMDLVAGHFKFRLDDSWDFNYGDNGNNLSLERNGADIPITAGRYKIEANFGVNTSDGIPGLSYRITPQ